MSTANAVKIEKIFSALKDHYKLDSDKALADFLGVDHRTLAAWKSRGKIAKVEPFIYKCSEIRLEWLKTGEGKMLKEGAGEGESLDKAREIKEGGVDWHTLHPPVYHELPEIAPKGYVTVPRYEVAASAGAGALVHSEQIVDHLAFKADWLKVSLGLSPNKVAVISVIGDSMEPYLAEGDLILVDLGVVNIENNAVYVLQFGDSLLVKRVQVKLDGEVIVKSDNPRYEAESFRGEAAERLRVVGRMVRRLVR